MDYDFNKAGLYPAAWAAFKANWQMISIFGAGLIFLEIVASYFDSKYLMIFGSIFIGAYIAFLFHKSIIYGNKNQPTADSTWKNPKWYNPQGNGTQNGFLWRCLLIFFSILGISMITILPFGSYFRSHGLSNDEAKATAIFFVIPLWLILYGATLAFIGTILPATVAKGKNSIKAAMARGRKTFWLTLGRLILGPLAFLVLATIGIGVAYLNLPMNIYNTGGWNWVDTIMAVPITFAHIFTTGLTATALCKSYLRYEQRPDQTPDPV